MIQLCGATVRVSDVHQGGFVRVKHHSIALLLFSLKQYFSTRQSMILIDQNTRNHSACTIGNRDAMHGVCTTQHTSRMGTARVKQEEESDT